MSLWDRLTGKVVDSAGLGQKKRAVTTGINAFADPLSDLRLEIGIKGHPWLQNSAVTSFLLASWVAQALQDMADVLVTAAQRHLGDPDKLPEASFLQADEFYDAALKWIEQGQSALAAIDVNPDYQLFLRLPAAAPQTPWISDAPAAHYLAVIQAAGQLGTSAEDALNNALNDRSRLAQKYDGAFTAISGIMRLARAKLDQVEAAASDRQQARLSQDIWALLAEVVRVYFLAGQQIARPALIDPRYDAYAQAAAKAKRLPPPPQSAAPPRQQSAQQGPAQQGPAQQGPAQQGPARQGPAQQGPARSPAQAGRGRAPRAIPEPPPPPPPPPPPTLGQRLGLSFDAWSLSDQAAASMYGNDAGRIAELEAFWRADTNPEETHRFFELITAAVKAGQVGVRPREFTKACPWTSTFVALSDVAIAGEQFRTGQLFTLKVGAEGRFFGRGFDLLGFLPGTQPARPRPDPPRPDGQGRPGIDTTHRGDRRRADRAPAAAPGSDIWLLTAAFQRPQRKASKADAEQLSKLWQADPDPAQTVRVHDEVLAAVRGGTVRQNGDESLRSCPWSQVYVALSQVSIGGVQLQQNEKFAIEISLTGGTFRRGILRLGSVRPGS